MAKASLPSLAKRLDQEVLVLTITAPEFCDDESAGAMRQELLAAVAPAQTRKVVLDFQYVQYIASAGIRLLLNFRRQFHSSGGRLVLCSLNGLISNVLNTARLIGTSDSSLPALFETAPDVSAAIARLNSQKETPAPQRS